jgi:aspartyl-tRNA(Asn)/glutamyl-tRNA(Gln) amidotransferase subunit A
MLELPRAPPHDRAVTNDPAFLSARALLDAFRARTLSPVEALDAVLHRLDAVNPRLNALHLVDRELGYAMARESEARWRKGEPMGPLDGVPVPIKDTNAVRGWPYRIGSRTTSPDAVDYDAPPVARLREAGAIFFGKTTTPEFGWKGVTDSPLSGVTRNPWDPSRTPGGSSGGAAVAVATGIGPIALGGDGGGSIRMPAAFTGIFGIKPTSGRVPNFPSATVGTMTTPGPMSREVGDAALMLRTLAEPDARDPVALPHQASDWLAGLEDGVKGLRIGFSADLGYVRVEPVVAAAVAEAVQILAAQGAVVEPADPGWSDPRWALDTIWRVAYATMLRSLKDEQRALLDPELARIVASARDIPAIEYHHALNERARLGEAMQKFHARYDLLVTPAMPLTAFAADTLTPDRGKYSEWWDWSPFTWPFNMTRQPAAVCPCGFDASGLPIGMQIVGPLYREDLVLRAARTFEAAQPFKMPPN